MDPNQAREALQTFKELFEDGIISQEEYDQKRQDALAMLTNSFGGMKRGDAAPQATASPARRPTVTQAQQTALEANLAAARSGQVADAGPGARATVTLEAQLAAILDSDEFTAEALSSTAAPAAAPSADPEGEEKSLAASIGYKRRKNVATLADHTNYVFSVAVVGSNLYSGSGDTTVKLWDLQTLKCAQTMEGHTAAVSCMEVAGKTLFSGSWDNSVRVWDTRSNKIGKVLNGHSNYVSSLLFDGQNLWTASWDCSVICWDVRMWAQKSTILKGGAPGPGGRPSFGHGAPVTSLALAPNGNLLTASQDKTVKVWDRRDGHACRKTIDVHDNWVFSMKVSGENEDDFRVWTTSRDKTVKKWNPLADWKCEATLTDHDDNVTKVEADATAVYTSSMDKTIKARDPATGRVVQTMKGHTNNVVTLLCAYNTLYSGSWDKTVKIWQ